VAVLRFPEPALVEEVIRTVHPHVIQCEPDEALLRILPPEVRFLPVIHDGPEAVSLAVRIGAAGRPVLFEASGRGGRGVAPDWSRAAEIARRVPLVLAGGLGPDNVGDAIRRVRPCGVDVSSGVESGPGVKDPDRMARFVAAVRRAEDSLENFLEVTGGETT
jgi:phosphoribosylanthranilate isomerase